MYNDSNKNKVWGCRDIAERSKQKMCKIICKHSITICTPKPLWTFEYVHKPCLPKCYSNGPF